MAVIAGVPVVVPADAKFGLDVAVVVETISVVVFPLLLLVWMLFALLGLLLPDNDNVECSIIVLRRLISDSNNTIRL